MKIIVIKLKICLKFKVHWKNSRGNFLNNSSCFNRISSCLKRDWLLAAIFLRQEFTSFCSKRTGPLEAWGFFLDKFIKSYKYLRILKILQKLEVLYMYFNFLKRKSRFLQFFVRFFIWGKNEFFVSKRLFLLRQEESSWRKRSPLEARG